jgi:serine/threonine-protein kinase
MLTASPPYPGGTMLQKLLSHGNAPPPDARELRPEVSDNLVAVIRKMLAKDPDYRYQTATDLIADLREVAFRDGLVRSQALSPVAISQPNPLVFWLEKHAPWMVAAILLLASAGWLHLESAALRNEIKIPPSAKRPLVGLPITAASRESVRNVQSSPDPSVVASNLGVSPNSTAANTDSASSQASGSFRPAAEPPQLRILAPRELMAKSEETNTPVTPAANLNETLASEAPFSMQGRMLIGEENVSLEPLDRAMPYVVRLVGPELEPGIDRDAEGAALAPTLSRALEMVAQYGASRLEIAVPIVYSGPVKVAVDNLLIKSTVGGSMIVFQPESSIDLERSSMFSIGSHQIELEDLHFVWNLPLADIDGGTLFEVNENDFVELTDCSITIGNPTQRDEVYAFDIITDPGMLPRQRRELSNADEFPVVRIKLNNVAVRGQMTMLHMDYAARLLLSWENGLLAITRRMIETAGARQKAAVDSEPIGLSLTRVTAHAPKGIVRMRIGVGGAYPLAIERTAFNSVFIVDPETPHFEIAGLRSLDNPTPLLQLRGASNAYAVEPMLEDPMLKLSTFDGETEITRMNDLVMATPLWAGETSPRWSVNWSAEGLSTAPANQRTPADYRQEGPFPPGFDEKYLPSVRALERVLDRPPADRLPALDTTDEDLSTIRSALKNSENRDEL